MNFRIFEVKFLAIILLLAVLFTMPSCSKKSPSNGKTLTSEKGKQKKGPLGRMMSWFSKKGIRDEPGLVSGEIVATTRKGWSQPTPFGMVLVPGGSFIMGQADEDVTSSVANFKLRKHKILPCDFCSPKIRLVRENDCIKPWYFKFLST